MNVSVNASSRRLSPLVSALVCLTMLGAGCGQQKVRRPLQEVDKQAMAADSLHMARLYAQWQQALQSQAGAGDRQRSQMPLELADDAQYRFVKNRLLAAGSTPDNSPQLFRRLETLRKQKREGLPDTTTTRKDRLTSEPTPSEPSAWCGHLLPLTDVATSDTSTVRFQASGLVTCFNGSDYAYTDVNAYATDPEHTQFRVLASQSDEAYAGAVLETPPLDLNLPVGPGQVLFVDSVAMAFNEASGESHLSYEVAESSVVAQGGDPHDINIMLIKHPRELIGSQKTDNPIRTCLERGAVTGYLDCDYASGRKDPVTGVFKPFAQPYTGVGAVDAAASQPPAGMWTASQGDYWAPPSASYDATHLYLPLRGEYRVMLPPLCTVDALTSDASLILLEKGGRCSAGQVPGTSVLHGSLPFKTPYLNGDDRLQLIAPFDGLGDFGGDCLTMYQNVRLLLRATLKATCVEHITGTRITYTRTRIQDIPNLDFRNSCLAEGTRVTKADGRSVPVEQVKVGDQLLANDQGRVLTVTSVSRGGERKPLVKLSDTRGDEVRVTETHPMMTAARGVVQAGELRVGDVLWTRTGAAVLVGVERMPYSGQVFNFALGTPQELASVGPEAHTLYANGFLVGDSTLQTSLEKQRVVDERDVLTRLHGAWHEDFRQHQARQKSARR